MRTKTQRLEATLLCGVLATVSLGLSATAAPAQALFTTDARLLKVQEVQAPPGLPTGSPVEGHIGSYWRPCVVASTSLGGGYVLHCTALPDDNVFSASDVRLPAAARPTPANRPAAAPQGRNVQGNVRGVWETCTVVGAPPVGGGYILSCPSLNSENIFSESDVREIGAAQPVARNPAPVAPQGRPVQGNVRGVWENCTMIGGQQGTGGYILHCPSLPDDSIFSASDVRFQ